MRIAVIGAATMGRGMARVAAAAIGPLKVRGLVGLDVWLAIAEYLFRELKHPHYEPPAILGAKVGAGELGKKTGKGFYQWPKKPS